MNGILVTGVSSGSNAALRGIGPGDVVRQVDDDSIGSAVDMRRGTKRALAGKHAVAVMLVMRKNRVVTAAQRLAARRGRYAADARPAGPVYSVTNV
jgi:S1-C subfamily serine protease